MAIEYRITRVNPRLVRKPDGSIEVQPDATFALRDTTHPLAVEREVTLAIDLDLTDFPAAARTSIRNKCIASITALYPGATAF